MDAIQIYERYVRYAIGMGATPVSFKRYQLLTPDSRHKAEFGCAYARLKAQHRDDGTADRNPMSTRHTSSGSPGLHPLHFFSTALLVFLLALSAVAQVSVNAQLVDDSGSVATAAHLHFELMNCGNNFPSATNLSTGQNPWVVVKTAFDIYPTQADGSILGQVIGNDQISCGNVTSTYYQVTAFKDATTALAPVGGQPFVICSGILPISMPCSNANSMTPGAATWNPALQQPTFQPVPPGFVQMFLNPTQNQTLFLGSAAGTGLTWAVQGGTVDFTNTTVLGLPGGGGGGGGGTSTFNGTAYRIPMFNSATGGVNSCLNDSGQGGAISGNIAKACGVSEGIDFSSFGTIIWPSILAFNQFSATVASITTVNATKINVAGPWAIYSPIPSVTPTVPSTGQMGFAANTDGWWAIYDSNTNPGWYDIPLQYNTFATGGNVSAASGHRLFGSYSYLDATAPNFNANATPPAADNCAGIRNAELSTNAATTKVDATAFQGAFSCSGAGANMLFGSNYQGSLELGPAQITPANGIGVTRKNHLIGAGWTTGSGASYVGSTIIQATNIPTYTPLMYFSDDNQGPNFNNGPVFDSPVEEMTFDGVNVLGVIDFAGYVPQEGSGVKVSLALASGGTSTWGAGSGFTSVVANALQGLQTQFQQTAGSITPTWTVTNTNHAALFSIALAAGVNNGPGSQNSLWDMIDGSLSAGNTITLDALCLHQNTGVPGNAGPKHVNDVTCTGQGAASNPQWYQEMLGGSHTTFANHHDENCGIACMVVGQEEGFNSNVVINLNDGNANVATSYPITAATESGSVATFTTSTPCGVLSGSQLSVDQDNRFARAMVFVIKLDVARIFFSDCNLWHCFSPFL